MVFSSLTFISIFLPLVFFTSLMVKKTSVQNVLLTIFSFIFYAYGEPVYVLLMLFVCIFVYVMALIMHNRSPLSKKLICAVAIIICLAPLIFLKYGSWFISIAHRFFGYEALPADSIVMPIGISFFTFQAISYVIDVYRGECKASKNLLVVLLYISFFPQLIAGPIIKFHDVENQFGSRVISIDKVSHGLLRFISGLAKKVLIADVMAKCADNLYAADANDVCGPLVLVAGAAYMFQIYFDFSGYSDMAIGMAEMFGFHYGENFIYPYSALSVKDFWKRWHISLSTWLKEYIYIPLGGNRRGRARSVANKIIVFFVCGLWHGAAFTYIAWGLIHGLFLLIEEYLPIKKLPKPIRWIYTMLVVFICWIFFRANSISSALLFMQQLFAGWTSVSPASLSLVISQLTPLFIITFVVAVALSSPILKKVTSKAPMWLKYSAGVLALCLCIITLAGGSYSPFIYFRF